MTLLNQMYKIKVEDTSKEAIEDLALSLKNNYTDDKYLRLLKTVFVHLNINDLIHENEIMANCKYVTAEDFFQEFAIIVYNAIFDYNKLDKGNFVGYVSMVLKYTYANIRKNAYFTVKTHVPKEKRKDYRFISFDSFESTLGYTSPLDKTVLFEEINKCVDNLPEFYRDLVRMKFFSSEKNVSNKKIGEKLNMSERQVRYYLGIAYQELYKMGIPNASSLQNEIKSDSEIEFYNDIDTSVHGALDKEVRSNNNYRTHYYYYT